MADNFREAIVYNTKTEAAVLAEMEKLIPLCGRENDNWPAWRARLRKLMDFIEESPKPPELSEPDGD